MKKPKRSISEWANRLIVPLYKKQFIQTLWNAEKQKNRDQGWVTKGELWVPWFLNMRPLGSSAETFLEVSQAMADLTIGHDIDMYVAVEMAGINISGGTAIASKWLNGLPCPIGYTRPLPKKVREPMKALQLIRDIDSGAFKLRQEEFKASVAILLRRCENAGILDDETIKALAVLKNHDLGDSDYGQKEFVEGRLINEQKVGILDDMAMNIGSKLIARLIILWEARKRGVSVECNNAFYFLNRTATNRQTGFDYALETERDLYPAPIHLYYVIEMDEELPKLESVMCSEEFRVITDFQNNSDQFQDEDVQKEVLALAKKARK
ncbi:hypothetical protein DRH27_00820 [Candidatus Falkowbacteria bacterium]|nr:MAG: hypothetical protein DRH27_00820 [Candidatus Falkowbacteria bacterium]